MVIDPYPTYDTQQKTSQASIRAIYEMSQLWPIYSLTANFIRIPGVSLQKRKVYWSSERSMYSSCRIDKKWNNRQCDF